MIVTGTCIILEQGEYNNVKFIENRPIFELSKIERLLPVAKRVVYDATASTAVKAILTSSASNLLCYPAMNTTALGSAMDTCTKHGNIDKIRIEEFMNEYKYIIENDYEKPSAKLLVTLVNRAVVTRRKSLPSAHVWCDSFGSTKHVNGIDVTSRSPWIKHTEAVAYAASSSILATDMASLSDALYKEGWLIQSFANEELIIESKEQLDYTDVSERKDRAKAIMNKAIGMYSKYDYYHR